MLVFCSFKCSWNSSILFSCTAVYFYLFLPQNANNKKIKQDSNTKANKCGEETQKKPWGYKYWAPSEQKIKLTVTVRPGSKVKNTIKACIGYLIT